MSFNPSKCEVIHISKKRHPIKSEYLIHGQKLVPVKEGKYLGVTISDNLSWKPHVAAATRKANNSLGFLRRNLSSCPPSVKARTYTTLVRPIMEYAATAWDPHTQTCIDQLEAVQRRAARFVKGNYRTTSSSSQMIADIGWQPLQARGQTSKVTMMYRIINNLIDIPSDPYLRPAMSSTRGSSIRYIVPFCRTDYLRHSFFPSATRLWNQLPNHLVTAPSLEAFKEGMAPK